MRTMPGVETPDDIACYEYLLYVYLRAFCLNVKNNNEV
jgi:hypothetical protein